MIKHKLIFYFHQTTIVLLCLALVAVLMVGSAHFVYRQQNQLSEQKLELNHKLIKQTAFSLTPLVERLGGNEDNTAKIVTLLQSLTQQPWVLDASVYQLNGQVIAQSNEDISIRQRLDLDKNLPDNPATEQIVEEINSKDGPLGFIRITLKENSLETGTSQLRYTVVMIWTMLLLAVAIGFILARAVQMKKAPAKGRQTAAVQNSEHGHKKKKPHRSDDDHHHHH